ncbi:MAG: 7,8-didemethyl-8-hydroxy-5-deazariboflavin synthase [Gammaproteobacteria bacterium]|nr:7,8-didemethyl-8-hydroxy-5-deazariboflavin synthase [Gammaproteobacteria bacterium]
MGESDKLDSIREGAGALSRNEALALTDYPDLARLSAAARELRDAAHGELITYSPKVFIPLTQLCRDVCHYCTFSKAPKHGPAYLPLDEVKQIAADGARVGCHEALFTLGDKPELRYRKARAALEKLGFETTTDYLIAASQHVLTETGMLPHVNPGVLTHDELARLREVSVSGGLMLESTSERLCQKGGPHYGSPDKSPAVRLDTLRAAGELNFPYTTGILIGIGETRAERIDALLAIRDLHAEYGHIQEVIVQNFRAKERTAMAKALEPPLEELVWTIAVARLILGPDMSIQAPPNLSPGQLTALLNAGINDWGGVSPVTPDHVNPEAPWPELESLGSITAANGKVLAPRLPIYPAYVGDPDTWLAKPLVRHVLRHADAAGLGREDLWVTGHSTHTPPAPTQREPVSRAVTTVLGKSEQGEELTEQDIVTLFTARGNDFGRVCDAADLLRQKQVGDAVSYVVNRNINYTNVCYFHCKFCAFSKGRTHEDLRGKPYDLDLDEVARRAAEAWSRGATEVCLQGGIHPDYTGQTYLEICDAIKRVAPDMHIHAFSPLEVWQGAETLGLSLETFLARLRDAGLRSLPGTAAEILDDEVRAILCPDKINTEQWFQVMRAAHSVGLRSTATMMFGHVDHPRHWARHLQRVRALQVETGGFTELVPLAFVAMEAPLYRRGLARNGPTYREAVLVHAVARIVLGDVIPNIQASWVKMGPKGAQQCLQAGANDLGGTLMNESITRAAGAEHGQELAPHIIEALAQDLGRVARHRNTLYGDVGDERHQAALQAAPLAPIVNTPLQRAS